MGTFILESLYHTPSTKVTFHLFCFLESQGSSRSAFSNMGCQFSHPNTVVGDPVIAAALPWSIAASLGAPAGLDVGSPWRCGKSLQLSCVDPHEIRTPT